MTNSRRRLQGLVVSNKMDKTVVVEVERKKMHRLYKKVIRVSKKYMAHDESNALNIGDEVTIVESRPMSKHKRWVVETVLSAAESSE
jgi:small subunit ribosomal protein S17